MRTDPTTTSAILRANEALEVFVRELVNHPDQVRVLALEGQHAVLYEISVKPEDICQVIGKGGRTVHALRELMTNLGARIQRRFIIEVADPVSEKGENPVPADVIGCAKDETSPQQVRRPAHPVVTYRTRAEALPERVPQG